MDTNLNQIWIEIRNQHLNLCKNNSTFMQRHCTRSSWCILFCKPLILSVQLQLWYTCEGLRTLWIRLHSIPVDMRQDWCIALLCMWCFFIPESLMEIPWLYSFPYYLAVSRPCSRRHNSNGSTQPYGLYLDQVCMFSTGTKWCIPGVVALITFYALAWYGSSRLHSVQFHIRGYVAHSAFISVNQDLDRIAGELVLGWISRVLRKRKWSIFANNDRQENQFSVLGICWFHVVFWMAKMRKWSDLWEL